MKNVLVPPVQQLLEPTIRLIDLVFQHPDHCSGAVDEQRSQLSVAPLADPQQRWLATTGVRSGPESEAARPLPSVFELLGVANRGAPGIAGMRLEDFAEFARSHWAEIRQLCLTSS
jgi:hypothetical protein